MSTSLTVRSSPLAVWGQGQDVFPAVLAHADARGVQVFPEACRWGEMMFASIMAARRLINPEPQMPLGFTCRW